MTLKIEIEQRKNYLFIKNIGTIKDLDEWLENDTNLAKEVVKYKATDVVLDQQEIVFPKSEFQAYQTAKSYNENLPMKAHFWNVAVVLDTEYEELGKHH